MGCLNGWVVGRLIDVFFLSLVVGGFDALRSPFGRVFGVMMVEAVYSRCIWREYCRNCVAKNKIRTRGCAAPPTSQGQGTDGKSPPPIPSLTSFLFLFRY